MLMRWLAAFSGKRLQNQFWMARLLYFTAQAQLPYAKMPHFFLWL
jgi:hypothetical protein